MLSALIFSTFASAQSFPEKPQVPIFHLNGMDAVRVDCWGVNSEIKSYHLEQTTHPKLFEKIDTLADGSTLQLSVSLLKSENTLTLNLTSNPSGELLINTYGMDCGFSHDSYKIYCSIFDGEINEN